MGALDHLRVVELGSDIMAPFCARVFADLGAEVIKVEPPEGDHARRRGPFTTEDKRDRKSGFFHYLNAGKSSIVADMANTIDRKLFDQLLAGADLFIENLPNNERIAWQLDSESLSARFPHLIVLSLSAYGRTGCWKDKQGTDITIQAASALSAVLGIAGSSPLRIPFDQSEYQASLHGVAAALCALIEREKSGLGQGIDISAAEVLGYQAGAMHLVTKKSGGKWSRAGKRNKSGIFPSGFFECADGHLCIATPHGRLWLQYLKLMGDPAWSYEENQRDAIYLARSEKDEPAHTHFRQWLLEYTRAELLEMTRGTDIILGIVNKVDEVYASEQFAFRHLWSEVTLGEQQAKFPKTGFLMSETPSEIRRGAPELGNKIQALADSLWEPRDMLKADAKRSGRALEGIRVLDFGWNWAGPMAGQLMADMGAEVIRVETNKRLDNMRLAPYSYYFCHNNRNKLSTTFNLKEEEGVRLIKELVKHSDVVMENFAAGVMARNGLSYEELQAVNPAIVMMSMSMAGETGPAKDMRGFASIATAYAGLEGMVGYPQTNDVVGFTSFGLGDTNMAIQGTIGILTALIHVQRTGRGQFVDVSQIECSTATLGEMLLEYELNKTQVGIQGNYHYMYAPHNFFQTRGQDQWIAVSVTDDDEWQGLCCAMGRLDLLDRTDLHDQQARRAKVDELDEIVKQWCLNKDRDDVLARLESEAVRCSPLLSSVQRDQHPAFLERNFVFHHDSSNFDVCDIYNTPWHLTATQPTVYSGTPAVGEDNDYVFRDILKLDDSDIERLVSSGILN